MKEPIEFEENTWFSKLDQAGHKIVVYQSESVDFCSPLLSQTVICNVFPSPNLNSVHRDESNPFMRAIMLVRNLTHQSAIISQTHIVARLLPFHLQHVTVFDGQLMDQLGRDIKAQPANAYFAHVLLPHAPIVYRQDCSIDYDSVPIGQNPRSTANAKLYKYEVQIEPARLYSQIQCGLKLLGDLFDEMEADGIFEKATIIVHGDHGTSAYQTAPMVENMDNLTYRDLQEAYSALFAVKFPGSKFKLNEEVKSLNVLMADTAITVLGEHLDESEIEIVVEPEPFVYLGGNSPMKKAFINIFKDPQLTEQTEDQDSDTER